MDTTFPSDFGSSPVSIFGVADALFETALKSPQRQLALGSPDLGWSDRPSPGTGTLLEDLDGKLPLPDSFASPRGRGFVPYLNNLVSRRWAETLTGDRIGSAHDSLTNPRGGEMGAAMVALDNTLGAATSLGTLVGPRSIQDTLSSADFNDYYRFELSQTSNFSLALNGLTANADVQLLNSGGTLIQSSTKSGTQAESISRSLNAGTYYARVYRVSGSPNYTLSLSADSAGNTLTTARNIGTLSSSQSFADFVGSTDTNDYYRFDLSQSSNFSLSLSGLSADADVQLLNSAGTVLSSSTKAGTTAESITSTLGTGTYYVRVFPYSGNTNYNLTVAASGATPPPTSLAIAPTNATQAEGNSGSKAFTFTVTRSGNTTGVNAVTWAVAGSGTNPANASDFAGGILPGGTISFAAGETSKVITVNVQGDTTVEPDENFTVSLSSPTNGATLTTASATGTIQNDDTPPPPSSFNSTYGYGLINAAAAVARALGQTSPFPDVANLGGNNWGNDLVKAPEVWARGYTGQGIVVAVVDTGVDYNHSDLAANIWVNPREVAGNGIDDDGNGFIDDVRGWDFVNNDNTPLDGNGHGTHVSGTIAALNNGFGVTGVAYNARIMPVQVLSNSGSGSSLGVANGIRYAANNGARVINLSLGGGYSADIYSAIQYATGRGSIVVMASGNEGAAQPSYPAFHATEYGLSIGAVDSGSRIASFSNRAGTNSAMRHVMAPGVGVYSTVPNNGYATYNGTSMATPHAAGVVALMLSANSSLSPAQVRDMVTGTATYLA